MKRTIAVLLLAACAGVYMLGAADSQPEISRPAITIYNQQFAVVRDRLVMDLQRGRNQVRFTDTTAHVEPDSVMLRDPAGRVEFQIVEQNYRSDPVSQELLLSLYEGKTIEFLVQKQDGTETVRGKIVRSGYVPHQAAWQTYGRQYYNRQIAYTSSGSGQPIIEVNGKLRFGLPGTPLFPALTDQSILKPTMHWMIESQEAVRFGAELSYVTGGMSWAADYNIVAPENGDLLELTGWVTIDNQSGKAFPEADIKLVAGDVHKIQAIAGGVAGKLAASEAYQRGEPAITERSFDEYHLYSLARPATLLDSETKQVEMIRASGIRSQRLYIYDGAKIDANRYRGWTYENIRQDREYGTISNPKVWVMREFMNSEKNQLGMALPKGRARFYRRDRDGRLEFVGENEIDHTPRDEKIRVYTGDAFDLIGERKRTNFNVDHNARWLDESFEMKLRNHKKESVTVRIVEHLYRWTNWEIREKSDAFRKTDSQTIEFEVVVPPDAEKKVEYTVHYSW